MAVVNASAVRDGTATCIDVLRRLFPGLDAEGSVPYLAFPSPDGSGAPAYTMPPLLPPDVFAAAATLLDLSGAYHHVMPELPRDRPSDGARVSGTGERTRSRRLVLVSAEDIETVRSVASTWRAFHPDIEAGWFDNEHEGKPLQDLFKWWKDVFPIAGGEPVFQNIEWQSVAPAWWKSAVMLLAAADEASQGIGYQIHVALGDDSGAATGEATTVADDNTPWIAKMVESQMVSIFEAEANTFAAPPQEIERFTAVSTISLADRDMAAVLPKARTTSVGCTLRSLSHHLALLPPRGVARASWTPYLFQQPPSDEHHLNLLLVPFPFSVPAQAFRPAARGDGGGGRWGFFGVEQTWLKNVTVDGMVDFIAALAEEAGRECGAIHGVVLPELALDQKTFEGLSKGLPERLPEIELLVAGQSGDPERRVGNFVSVTVYQRDGSGGKEPRGILTRREKHHRWKIDRRQILDYGLEGVLSPSLDWWEDIDLLSRRVDFSVFRAHSVFSAMICEDLARVDPCQELLRSIGPSLIFALLMDAPQLQARWPGRYATVLAEDPGTAVLTLTSRALMTRQNRLGLKPSKVPEDRVIGLWRDDGGQYVEIECPEDAQAVRLTLSATPSIDVTLDGRDDRTAVSWRYAARRSIRLPDAAGRFGAILGFDELAAARRLSDGAMA